MFNKSIVKVVEKSEVISEKLESVTFNSIRKILPDHAILNACREEEYGYRCRLVTPIVIVLHMITAAIWPEESFSAAWQLAWSSFSASFPYMAGRSPSRAGVAKSRKRLPLAVWQRLTHWICQQTQQYSTNMDKWRGHRVVLVDGTCLTLPDEPELREDFPPPKGNHGYGRYPLARMVCVSLARTMTVINYRIGKYRQDENTLLTPMLETLRNDDLLVADRHFAGANLYHNYMTNGLEYLTRAHQRLKISRLKRLYAHSANDFVAKLKIADVYRRRNPELPKYITARFIKVTASIRGKSRDIWLVTSLLDAAQYPADEIAELYLQRWRIETLFRQFKVDFGSDQLRSKSVDTMSKEVAARICAINIVRTIMLEAAGENNVPPMRISFVAAVRTIIAYAPALGLRPSNQLCRIYHAMLKEIASHLVPERPGRVEPRRLAHDPKHYPRLRITRAQWRAQHAA
jgi:hypothetical protein